MTTVLKTLASIAVLTLWLPAALCQSQLTTVWEWNAREDPQAWEHNIEVTDVEATAEGVSFRTTGADPILTYRRSLNVPLNAWQALEVTLKADAPGVAEVFWTETTEGRYGGFSGEKSTRFHVVGDGTYRTYRLFPFWHRIDRLVRLRFDPYGMARFSLQSVRIVEWSVPPAGGSRLSMPRDARLMLPVHGVRASAMPTGLSLSQEVSDGFVLAPVSDVMAEEKPCISLRITSTKSRRAVFVFLTDAEFGLQELAFDLVADGKPRVYNLDGFTHRAWKGRIVAVGFRPREGLVLHELSIAEQPAGPAELRIQAFDAVEALPRAGRPVRFAARVWNAGGQIARGGRLVFELPQGARVVARGAAPNSRTYVVAVPALHYGEEFEASCTVLFGRPVRNARLGLRAELAGRTTGRATCSVTVTSPPRVVRSGYPPEPKPVRGPIEVGVYYFPGWKTSGQWSPITRFPERRPVLGWYREGDPSVADWHIKWAVEHGITFFAYDWYWVAGARSLEHALHDGYLKSRYRQYLKFCLLWANHNPPDTSSHEDFMAVVQYWLDNYFKLPEYYTIDGKPVVIIFSPYRFRADMGSEAVRRSFDAMREECRKAGLPGLYLIACVGGDPGEARLAANEGYDAVSAYNWPHLGVRGGERIAPFADLLEPHRIQWERLANEGPLPLMTPVSGGWDSRPWHGETALVRSGRTPELFRRHLQDAKRFIESHPGKALPVALIEAWNEFGEGSYIEPHREYGFAYLDAIRDVFTSAPPSHVDLTPDDVGHRVPQVDVTSYRRGSWDLSRDAQGWDAGMELADIRIEDGALTARTAGRDPAFFGPPMQVHASTKRTLVLRMRLRPLRDLPPEDVAQVFWTTRSTPTSEEASVRFPVKLDGQWHEYRVPLAGNQRWRGLITSLRLDPCNHAGVEVAVARIHLE